MKKHLLPLFLTLLASTPLIGAELPAMKQAHEYTVPNFYLYDQYGQPVTQDSFNGKYTVVNFFFTRCLDPNMCPAATKFMVQLQKALPEDVQLFSITFDPQFDNPDVLKHYAKTYGANANGKNNYRFLTGNPATIKQLQKHFSLVAKNVANTIAHNHNTLLFDPQGRCLTVSPQPAPPLDQFTSLVPRKQPAPSKL